MGRFPALLRHGRVLAALLLLATFVAGEVADARHHLSEHGCAADAGPGRRDDNCTCASLHAAPLAGHAPVALAPAETHDGAPAILVALTPRREVVVAAAPRAPPRS
jgi:hypothetical protein